MDRHFRAILRFKRYQVLLMLDFFLYNLISLMCGFFMRIIDTNHPHKIR